MTSFLARNDSPYPLKHFQGQFPKSSPDHGKTWKPAGGYKALNNSDLRWQVITYHRNIGTFSTGNRPPPRFILKASQPAPPPAPPKGPPFVLTPRPPPLPPPAHLFPSATEQPASARSEARTFSDAPWRSTKWQSRWQICGGWVGAAIMFRCPGASFSRSKIWIWTHPIYQNIGGSFANVWISIPNSGGLWIIMSANLPYPGAVAALSRSLCCGGRAMQIRALCVQTSKITVAHMSTSRS